jgi:hypothetical protein
MFIFSKFSRSIWKLSLIWLNMYQNKYKIGLQREQTFQKINLYVMTSVKRAYKISRPPRLWVSWVDLPSYASSSKIWPNFNNKVFFSWSYEKVMLTKNVRLIYYSSMKKKFRKIRMIFDIENSVWKSNFCTLRRSGKARQSIPERS